MPENPYHAPDAQDDALPASSSSDWTSHFALIARHTLLLLAMASLLLFIVPFYAARYEGWELKLSEPLGSLVWLSKTASSYWYLAAVGVPIYYVVLLQVRPKTANQRILFAVWSLLYWTCAIGIFPLAAFLLGTPFISITIGLTR